uniref:DENN domain containing 1A n=1 Tax=Ornithorhynchus anatinus TaxID=9258 RepID=F6VYM4_ORNAN
MGSRIKQNPETTFEVYAEVTYPGTSGILSDPEVLRQFPEDYSDQEVLQTLTKFCFPFYVDSLAVSQVGQNFTFVLTDIDSKQRFGFCRLSSGAKSCFCILSYLPWFEVFYKLLNILADYTAKGQESQRNELLETLHKLPIPDPGDSVHLSVHSYFTVPDIRDLPSIPENRNLTEYFVAVDVNNMLHLYASMLYERRILIICSKLSTLTACIHGSAAMLYPMFWQHVYIPVLPPHLLDYCCAPMPYLIGIHLSLMEKVRNMALEDVVILNVDTNTLETPFDDLQSLPNDVEEPITFCEETFVSHRSSAMRQFLQNAIQLQLFKQFIDGRLDLLNSGEGFSDVFEEEINMGEYAGSDKLYHQWLSTVRKGSGAILNTVKTKANPAMKTVYKFAKDHAKMGIKEVKNRLKQKDIAENGCTPAPEELPKSAPSPLVEKKDPKLREDRRPITVHFGQVRPPRPHVVKRPKSNITMEGRRTSVSSPEQPQPYRTLKESDSADGVEVGSPEKRAKNPPPSHRPPPDKITDINLLEDIFSNLEVEVSPQPLSQAKSLEDLRAPKEQGDQSGTFGYQRMDLGGSDRSRMMPALKLSHPYNKLWAMGQDDMAIPSKYSQCSPERPLASLGSTPSLTRRLRSRDSILAPVEKEEMTAVSQGSITIPRPQGRKTPELGIVPPPPTARPTKHQAAGAAEAGKPIIPGQADHVTGLLQDPFPAGTPTPHPAQFLSTPSGPTELLQPMRVVTQTSGNESDFLLSLLDPLKSSWQAAGPPQVPSSLLSSAALNPAGFPTGPSDFASTAAPFGPKLGFHPAAPTPAVTPPFLQPCLNPFTQPASTALPVPRVQSSGPPFAPAPAPPAPAFASSFLGSNSGFFPAQRPQPNLSALSMPNLFGQMPSTPQAGLLQQPSLGPTQAGSHQQVPLVGPSKIRTLPLVRSGSRLAEAKQGLGLGPGPGPRDPPLLPPRPPMVLEPVLQPLSKAKEATDPFEDLLRKTKQEIAPTPGDFGTEESLIPSSQKKKPSTGPVLDLL